MKQLTDSDLNKMAATEFIPDDKAVKNSVRQHLKLSHRWDVVSGDLGTRSPYPVAPARIDLHNHTIEQAWERLLALVESGARRAVVITGASGVLKTEFQKWMTESIISHRIISCVPLNNGSFEIQIRKN